MPDPSLLLLIPAYNEECRIEPVLRDFAQFFGKNYSGKFQLVVVLNGCAGDTLGVVRRVAAEFPAGLWVLEFKEPIGKGGALIEGLKLAAFGDLIGYVDADGATPPHAFHELVRRIAGVDCAIGSRWLSGAVGQGIIAVGIFITAIFGCFYANSILIQISQNIACKITGQPTQSLEWYRSQKPKHRRPQKRT